jgi:L-fucose isomerase-like protein
MKPKIGVILLRAQWFDEVVDLPQLSSAVKDDADALLRSLTDELVVTGLWVVNSRSSLDQCVDEIKSASFDLALLVFQVWAEDFYLNPLVDVLKGTPLAVWCYQPAAAPPKPASFLDVLRYSGMVGTLEGLGTLHNLGQPYVTLIGSPESRTVQSELVQLARAANVYKALKSARFGLLPARNDQMQSTFVDEFRLRSDLGPAVEYLSVNDLKEAADRVKDAGLQDHLRNVIKSVPIKGVSAETLETCTRVSIGLFDLAAEKDLDVLSINDTSDELHRLLGLRPCLNGWRHQKNKQPIIGLEGDLGAATAQYILNQLTGEPNFFTEFWFWDEKSNCMVGGHAGYQNLSSAREHEAWISQDFEYCQTDPCEGAHYQFACKPGTVTLLQIRWSTRGYWQAIMFSARVEDESAWIEGYPHAVVKPTIPVPDLVKQAAEVGTTQHWIMAYGDYRAEIKNLCRLCQIELKEIC